MNRTIIAICLSIGTFTPALAQTAITQCNVAKAPAFGILDNVISGPDQKPFLPRGINIMEGNEPTADAVLAAFPGTNFIRYALYDYPDPARIAPFIRQFTSQHIVVEPENHASSDGQNRGGGTGVVFTGTLLANESSWYSRVAAYFIDDPYVWFGTNNEPPASNPAALSNWQNSTYNAIRGTGNLAPILVEVNGWADPSSFGQGYTASIYAQMTNIISDVHIYPWLFDPNLSNSAIASKIQAIIATTQKNIVGAGLRVPVVFAEYGNSTDGVRVDINGTQVVAAVGASGVGSAAWAWGMGNPGDGLNRGDGYGDQVRHNIANIAAIAARAAGSGADPCPTTATAETSAAPAPIAPIITVNDYKVAIGQADSDSTDADGQIAKFQRQVTAIQSAAQTPSLHAVGDTRDDPLANEAYWDSNPELQQAEQQLCSASGVPNGLTFMQYCGVAK